ncbi:hypothetical protein ACQEVB_12710 [Pseudonocardia sp. CA-107938]|uniref:hypothetical protein n=1 Tax=Pseudonocardia sp. CA-107938 TaxID=3240021 RepID=UPI003D8B6AEE
MNDEVKCCALPGCDVAIVDVPGRPARRYCSAAHRHAARSARRAAMRPEVQARLSETLPWLREPVPRRSVPVAPAASWVPPRSVPTRGPQPARTPAPTRPRHSRRRAAAVLGAVGILAGGYAVSATMPFASPVQPAQAGRVPTDAEWAAEAEVALASVTQQLDTIARTEAEYSRLPAPDRSTVAALPYAALQQRKSLLERRKAALQSQLDSFRALGKARADLATSQARLDAVEAAIAKAPPRAPGSSEEATAVAVLDQQRELRTRQRDARKAELASLEDSVAAAAQAPLPADAAQTDAVSSEVLEAMKRRDGGRRPGRPSGMPTKPEIVAGRGEQPKERDDTASSGPPDPRGPADDHPRSRASAQPRSDRSPVGQALGTVLGGVAHGLDAATGAGQKPQQKAQQKPTQKADRKPAGPSKPAKVVDGAQETVLGKRDEKPAKAGLGKVVDGAQETLAGKRDEKPAGPSKPAKAGLGKAVDGAQETVLGKREEKSAEPRRAGRSGGSKQDTSSRARSGTSSSGRGNAAGGLTYWGGGSGTSERSADRTTTAPRQRSGASTFSRTDESGTSTFTRDRDGFTATRTTPDGRRQSVRVGNDGSMTARESSRDGESSVSRPSTKSQRQSRSSSDDSGGDRRSGSDRAESSSRTVERSTSSSRDSSSADD